MANPVYDALVARARTRASEPAITFAYANGQRTELSAITLFNAVAKNANLLREEFDVEAGSAVSLTIPWHWQRAPWLIACLTLGADVRFTTGATIEVGTLDSLDGSSAIEQLAVSMHPFGLPLGDLPAPLVDAAAVARLQPDAFMQDDADNAAWLDASAVRGARWMSGDRVLAAGDCGWEVLLSPLATPASLVMAESVDDVERIVNEERTTLLW